MGPETVNGFTLTEAAELLGKKPDTLKSWFSKGCPHDKEGRTYVVNVAAVFAWRIDYERRILQGQDGDDEGPLVLEHERAKLAKEQRIQVRMANEVRRGELVEAEEVKRAWGEILGAVRAKVMAIGAKVGARVGGKEGRKIKALVDEQTRKALLELSHGD